MPPLVSVTMPVFNTAGYLAASIESILGQTFTDFEFIIIDDGSTDNSLEILRKYERMDSRIRLVSRPNTGHTRAHNEMLEMVRGQYMAKMDSDDISMPDRFAEQVDYFKSHPEVVIVGGHLEMMDERGRKLMTQYQPLTHEQIDQFNMQGHASIFHPVSMMRVDAVRKVGGYNPEMVIAQDLELVLRLAEVGRVANINKMLLRYRIRTTSISGKSPELQREMANKACALAAGRRGIPNQFTARDNWRAGNSAESQHAFTVMYGWWAFNSRERRTAMDYGLRAVTLKPFDVSGWKLLICSMIKTSEAS